MRGTIIFRNAIRQILNAHNATFYRTYTDRVNGNTNFAHPRERRITFYQVCVARSSYDRLKADVEAAGGYITGTWVNGKTAMCNIKGRVFIR